MILRSDEKTPNPSSPADPGSTISSTEATSVAQAAQETLGELQAAAPEPIAGAPGEAAQSEQAPLAGIYDDELRLLGVGVLRAVRESFLPSRPAWDVRPDEEKAIADALVPVMRKYLPAEIAKWSPEVALLLAVASYAGRAAKDDRAAKRAAKGEGEPVPTDAPTVLA